MMFAICVGGTVSNSCCDVEFPAPPSGVCCGEGVAPSAPVAPGGVSSTTTTVLPELALLASKFASPPISMSSVTSGGFGSLSICTCDLSSSPRYCGRSWTGSRKESAALVVCFLHVRGAPDAPALLRSPFEMR